MMLASEDLIVTHVSTHVSMAEAVRRPQLACPGDTVFYNEGKRNRFDAIVCMYHDQGHIPMKTLDFDGGVNVTLGLPIVRTPVDHGTA